MEEKKFLLVAVGAYKEYNPQAICKRIHLSRMYLDYFDKKYSMKPITSDGTLKHRIIKDLNISMYSLNFDNLDNEDTHPEERAKIIKDIIDKYDIKTNNVIVMYPELASEKYLIRLTGRKYPNENFNVNKETIAIKKILNTNEFLKLGFSVGERYNEEGYQMNLTKIDMVMFNRVTVPDTNNMINNILYYRTAIKEGE